MDDARRQTLTALTGAIGGAGLGVGGVRTLAGRDDDISAGRGDPRQRFVVTDFVKGDGVTNGDRGLAALHDIVARRHLAGNTALVVWPAGRYVFSAMPNWAITCLHMHFEGEVWLVNTGPGDGLMFDGGATGTGAFGLRITGFPRIYGGRMSRNGVYARSIYRSQFEISCRGAGEGFSGFHGEWLVSNEIRFSMNVNEGGLYSRPGRGMLLTSRGNQPDRQSSYNSLYEPEFSGLPKGLVLDGALGNKVFGGAFQGNDLGAELLGSAWTNKFFGTDFESNGTDVLDQGRTTQFYGCDFEKGPVLGRLSRNASVTGGETNTVRIEKGARGALVSGTILNRFGTGGMEDAGVLTRSHDIRDAQTSATITTGATAVPTPSRSPYVYTNTSRANQAVLVRGDAGARLFLRRDRNVQMPVSGQYILGPDDGIRIEFDGAMPSVEIWTL